jgi:hypothetical protein
MLSDGGAIYTLGTSSGSVIRNNVFHDVWSFADPPFGWGIYLDATCSGYLVENNVVYNIHSGCLMYSNGGHEHVIRNNIFAFPANHMLWPFWEKRPNTFRRNLMLMNQGTLFVPFTENSLRQRLAAKESLGSWDDNLYWHTGEKEQLKFFKLGFTEWQALGLDRNSILADPQFVNAEEYDFRLRSGSPALKLGFQPIDTSRAGLYGDPAWVDEARRVKHPKTVFPPPPSPPPPLEVSEDFEKYEPGAAPDHALVAGEEKGASIRVTDQQAAAGKRSLKITDAKGLEPAWQPHFFFQPRIAQGTVRQSFDLKLQPGALMFTEWRDEAEYPACIGPSVTFDGAGHVTAGGRLLATVPTDGWIHVEIQAPLGKDARRTYTLSVAVPDAAPQVFRDLPMAGKAFRELHWLGFVSTATADTAFFVDNLCIQRVDRPVQR